jgi:hypothetical protein
VFSWLTAWCEYDNETTDFMEHGNLLTNQELTYFLDESATRIYSCFTGRLINKE